MKRLVFMTLAALSLGATPAHPQPHSMVGERVRVHSADGSAEGEVLAWRPDSMELRAAGSVLRFDWTEVRGVERHRLGRRTVRGLMIGGVVGAVAVGTYAAVTWEPCTALCFGPEGRGVTALLAAALGGAAGAGVGALVGTFVRNPSWEPVAAPTVSNGSTAGLRLGVRWSSD